jgi:hypothetical protein
MRTALGRSASVVRRHSISWKMKVLDLLRKMKVLDGVDLVDPFSQSEGLEHRSKSSVEGWDRPALPAAGGGPSSALT